MDEHEVTKRLAAQHAIMETKISRKLIEEHAPFNQLKRWTSLAILFILTVIVISLLYLYRTPPERIFVARIKTNTALENYSKRYSFLEFGKGSGTDSIEFDGSQLAGDGDVFATANGCFLFDSKKDSLKIVDQGDSLTYINGQLAGIQLSKDWNVKAWFNRITADSLRQLQSLMIEPPIETYVPFLEKIAKSNQNLSVSVASNDSIGRSYINDLTTISRLFAPRFLFVSLSKQTAGILNKFNSVKTLMLQVVDDYDQPLPSLPNLRECIVCTTCMSSDSKLILHDDFLKDNRQVEKLTVIGEDSIALTARFMRNLPRLKQLSTGDRVYLDAESVHQIVPGLTTLIIADSCNNIPAIGKFKELKWLGLPPNTNQADFDGIVDSLPNLKVLEMGCGDSINDLSAIEKLKDLKGLVIVNELPGDSNRLCALKQLRYLSIPEDSYSDSLYRQKLAKALPGCIIVPNAGACLGSGWLLLLIRLVTLIIYFRRRNSNAARQL